MKDAAIEGLLNLLVGLPVTDEQVTAIATVAGVAEPTKQAMAPDVRAAVVGKVLLRKVLKANAALA